MNEVCNRLLISYQNLNPTHKHFQITLPARPDSTVVTACSPHRTIRWWSKTIFASVNSGPLDPKLLFFTFWDFFSNW